MQATAVVSVDRAARKRAGVNRAPFTSHTLFRVRAALDFSFQCWI
jgi:hypothetical protein